MRRPVLPVSLAFVALVGCATAVDPDPVVFPKHTTTSPANVDARAATDADTPATVGDSATMEETLGDPSDAASVDAIDDASDGAIDDAIDVDTAPPVTDSAIDDTRTSPPDTAPTGTPCLYCVGTCATITADSACYVTCATHGYRCKFDATKPITCVCF
jgi:hypothetical protein